MNKNQKTEKEFVRLVRILDELRGEEGCPWDKIQDEKSIMNYLLEEVYELAEAIIRDDPRAIKEEIGDVMMELVFLAQISKEKKRFEISDVLQGVNQKMVNRHPYVFAKSKRKKTPAEVAKDWQKRKEEEKEIHSIFDGMVKNLPSLLEAFQVGLKASSCGFDWDDAPQAFKKVKEELMELEKVLEEKNEKAVYQEIGDVLFSLANVSRLCGVNPEIALKGAIKKFIRRFRMMEDIIRQRGMNVEEVDASLMDRIWQESKQRIKE